jgi:hypothetical protein
VKRDLAALDRAIELLLPSFSTLIVAAIGLAAAHLHGHGHGLRLLLPIWVTLLSVLAWVVFPVAGLIVDRAPAWAYQALAYAPIYILWRIAQGLQATFKRGRVDWVRTRRREE